MSARPASLVAWRVVSALAQVQSSHRRHPGLNNNKIMAASWAARWVHTRLSVCVCPASHMWLRRRDREMGCRPSGSTWKEGQPSIRRYRAQHGFACFAHNSYHAKNRQARPDPNAQSYPPHIRGPRLSLRSPRTRAPSCSRSPPQATPKSPTLPLRDRHHV